jgi:hypothetical protein
LRNTAWACGVAVYAGTYEEKYASSSSWWMHYDLEEVEVKESNPTQKTCIRFLVDVEIVLNTRRGTVYMKIGHCPHMLVSFIIDLHTFQRHVMPALTA